MTLRNKNGEADDPVRLTIAIGPVQGCLDPLRSLIDHCDRYAAGQGCAHPRYVLLGNTIGHGPDSAGVIAFLREFELEQDVVALRGAHEQAMIDTILGGADGARWSGAADVIASYGFPRFDDPELPSNEMIRSIIEDVRSDKRLIEDAEWLTGLPLTFEDGLRVFVHAGQRSGLPLVENKRGDLLALREPFLTRNEPRGKLLVHGSHASHRCREPEVRSDQINLDTNAWWSGILVAGIFDQTREGAITFLEEQ